MEASNQTWTGFSSTTTMDPVKFCCVFLDYTHTTVTYLHISSYGTFIHGRNRNFQHLLGGWMDDGRNGLSAVGLPGRPSFSSPDFSFLNGTYVKSHIVSTKQSDNLPQCGQATTPRSGPPPKARDRSLRWTRWTGQEHRTLGGKDPEKDLSKVQNLLTQLDEISDSL